MSQAPRQPPKRIARPRKAPAPTIAEDTKEPDAVVAPKDLNRPEKSTLPAAVAAVTDRYPAMNEDFVFIDNLYRSRLTLLDILRDRGYDVSAYERFSPAEATAAVPSLTALSFHVTKPADPRKQCHVRYEKSVSQQKMKNGYFNQIVTDEECEHVEIIVMLASHVTDTHHAVALREYMRLKEEPNDQGVKERRRLRVSFFAIDMMVINPLRHVLVPKHEIVPEEEHKALMERLFVTSKSKMPEIKYHLDPIARCIGAAPGDIVKITRPSLASGEAVIYRVCAP